MRVTFVVSTINLSNGGGSNYSFHLTASQLGRLGHDVRVQVLTPSGVPAEPELPYRVVAADAAYRTRLGQIQLTEDLLREHAHDTDVFHLYAPQLAFGAGRYRARGGRVPVAVTLNSYQLFCTDLNRMDGTCHARCGVLRRLAHSPNRTLGKLQSVPMRLYEQWLGFEHASRVDRFLPDSPAVHRIYEEAGFDMARSTLIPEVIDVRRIRASGGEPPGRPPDGVWHVLFAGRLVPAKGADLLIDALARLDRPVHLHVAGDGPERAALEARAGERGLAGRTTFHGWVPNQELWPLFRRMHLFVHPGRWPEPCGRTVQEAMALGVPALVSDTGGPPWLVGEHGTTFAPSDTADLAEKLRRCLDRYEDTALRARRAQARAEEFDYPRVVHELECVYEELVRDAPGGSRPSRPGRPEPAPWRLGDDRRPPMVASVPTGPSAPPGTGPTASPGARVVSTRASRR